MPCESILLVQKNPIPEKREYFYFWLMLVHTVENRAAACSFSYFLLGFSQRHHLSQQMVLGLHSAGAAVLLGMLPEE